MTRAQIERQSLTSIDAVLRNVNGIAVSFMTRSARCTTRAASRSPTSRPTACPATAAAPTRNSTLPCTERIDIVRGANGIQTGVGVPSATINMIRKRPQREFAASVALTAGSWNLYRGELDLNAPLNSDGSVRSRLVVAPQKKRELRDRYSEDKTALLAAVEADIGQSTVVALGYQRQSNDPKAPIWGTIPRFATTGAPIDLPISTSFSPSWTRWERTSGTLYATLDHQLNDDWSLKAALNHTEGDTFRLSTYGYGATTSRAPFIDPVTGAGTTLYAAAKQRRQRKAGHGGRLPVGQVRAGRPQARPGGGHEFHPHRRARTDGYTSVAGWSYVIPNIYTWDGNAPAPTYSKTGAWRTQITQQTGLFASARWRVTDPLSVLTGLRLTDWHRHSDTYGTTGAYAGRSAIQDENRKVTPFIGAVYDITPTLSAYASYARIFNPQNYTATTPAVARHRQQCRGWASKPSCLSAASRRTLRCFQTAGQLRRARRRSPHRCPTAPCPTWP